MKNKNFARRVKNIVLLLHGISVLRQFNGQMNHADAYIYLNIFSPKNTGVPMFLEKIFSSICKHLHGEHMGSLFIAQLFIVKLFT